MSGFVIENGVLKKYTGKGKDVVIPESVTKIGDSAFFSCSGLTSITIPGSVMSIGDQAFSYCRGLTNVTIPDSVMKIGDDAFAGCSGLKSVTIPGSVTKIGDCVFECCSGLMNVTIPNSVMKIGNNAFRECRALTNVTIPDGVISIGNSTFYGCNGLTSVTISDSVTKIGKSAFSYCNNLTSVTIGNGVTEIGDGAFSWCSGLTSVTIPDGITSIGKQAFSGCRGLTSVTIPDSVTSIGDCAFFRCSGLTSITIPGGVTEIGDGTFSDCNGLTYNEYDNGLYIGNYNNKYFVLVKAKNTWITSCNIHNYTKFIHSFAFNGCNSFTSVTIPDSVTKIGDGVFHGCSGLTSVTVGSSVKTIEWGAFDGCVNFKNVILKNGKDLLWFAENSGNYAPLCCNATEEEMAELIKAAAKWDKDKKEAFYNTYMISETRAAILLAEKRKEMEAYAEFHNTTVDDMRDNMLSDLGLDEDGCKKYDIGNMTVNVRMLPDFTFTVELPDGKASKSIPKKGADEKKYEEANKDFSEIKKNVKKIWKNRSDVILSDFITGKEREASYWRKTYTDNPVLRGVASLIVWEQNGAYFTQTEKGPVSCDGVPYELGEGTISVAHPLEMTLDQIASWQKYFTDRALKQPFAQIWELVHKPEDIKPDRYKDCPILFFALQGAGKHGFDEKLEIPGCKIETNWTSEKAPNGNSVSYCNITSFKIEKYSRAVNHAIAYLDRTTVLGRIAKDDLSVMDYVEGSNIAQITDYIEAASNAKAVNVLAALMEYKNKTYPDVDPMAEFTLEW